MDWLGLFSALAPILSNASQNRAAGKIDEATLAQQQNQAATSRYQAMVNAGRLKDIEQPAANLSQVGKGSLMSTWKPMSITPASVPYGSNTNGAVMPTITGGPSITPEMRTTGASVARTAMARQLGGNKLDTTLFPSDSDLGLNALPKTSWLDSLLGGASTATSILGGLKQAGLLGGKSSGVSAIGANGIPQGGTTIPPETLPTTGNSGLFPVGGGGASGGVGGNAGWMADEFIKMLMRQGIFAGGGSPWDQPINDYSGWALPGEEAKPRA